MSHRFWISLQSITETFKCFFEKAAFHFNTAFSQITLNINHLISEWKPLTFFLIFAISVEKLWLNLIIYT